ncbi:hypothetical protein HanXRQr2_Chr03g0104411 [Helianthus annuus]|uniref:Secreted protein n=1 Tax=Helianthus annuus TaxID=4232 RepID=A0A9K3JED2_HELAN|nr:hypothetical protein HanXRQr2_Chr03g0104411 [Helianthus annuus]KAJ0600199.1 hypothetical protein HanIR_Chr03g0113871 [Helianthus annuus]KAJ0773483.1 hypothetical protein HanOQP8_Chr03g0099831 [Helianthus annuus]KAJ0874475.1 hypothetical protein HanPSC8_Chr11g0464531 [Helianthus annuus]KAJ0943171.1 hypothetical protein HanPSC8_Chr03g0100901 [Helianthus annuus]
MVHSLMMLSSCLVTEATFSFCHCIIVTLYGVGGMKSGRCATRGRYASTCQNSGVVQKAGGVGGGMKGRRYLTRGTHFVGSSLSS